jgi:glycosyltransferase involved in cell wall biosynthesis
MDVLEWSSYHAATRCIGLSPGIVSGITRRGIDTRKVTMIPNGCDLELFHPEIGEAIRPEGVTPEDFMAIFSGAHGIANGLDAVLAAAAELKRRGRTDIKLVMVGDGQLKPSLMKQAEAQGLDNCIFLSPISKKELTSLQRGADAGLMILANVPAFYYGTSPNKFFDYISTGLPVLNNYPGWLADLIQQNHCGVVVPPENPQAFADALEYLKDHRDERYEMGKKARKLAESEFSREALAGRFVKWLEEAAGHEKSI